MKQLEWIQPDHLEMSLDLRSEVVVTAIHKARQGIEWVNLTQKIIGLLTQIELLEIDTKKSPLEKLQCIVRCCNSIFGIFEHYKCMVCVFVNLLIGCTEDGYHSRNSSIVIHDCACMCMYVQL